MDKNLKELGFYVLLAYGFSWLTWTPYILNSHGMINFPVPALLPLLGPIGTFGPMIAALFLAFKKDGKAGLTAMFRRGFSLGFNKIWLVVAIVLWPALHGIAMLLAIYHGGSAAPEILLFSQPLMILLPLLRTVLLGGPLGEEMGWRGYALDRLQTRFNALVSSLFLGVIWAFWHLPLHFAAEGRGMPFPLFLLIVVSQSPIYTWLYNNSNRSLIPVIVFHTLQNYLIFNVLNMDNGITYFLPVFYCAVALILVIWKPKRLVRKS